MSESVISDLMTFLVNTRSDGWKLFGLHSDQEKCGRCMLPLQNVENFRGPIRIGSVIERKCDLVWTRAIPAYAIRLWQRIHNFIADQAGGVVNRNLPLAIPRGCHNI